MLDEDSPLRRLPEALDPTQAMFLNGIRFCAEVVQAGMRELRKLLAELTVGESRGDIYPLAMMDAWSVVDSANRMRVVLEAMKRVGWVERSAAFRARMRALESALPLRDSAQHLDERIRQSRPAEEIPPVWGALSWFMITKLNDSKLPIEGQSCILIPGSVFLSHGLSAVNPAGREFRSSVDVIGLEAFGTQVSLSTLEMTIERLVEPLEDSLRTQIPPGSPTRGADLLLRMTFAFGSA